MLIFISYPREFSKLAEKLEVELQNRDFDTFLDAEHIKPAHNWKIEVEKNIKEASVFVILYDPKAVNQKRYFLNELHLIRTELRKKTKNIITVIFPPTQSEDLPPYLSSHQLIEANINLHTDNGNNDFWIDTVVREAERLKEFEVNEAERLKEEDANKRKKEEDELKAAKKSDWNRKFKCFLMCISISALLISAFFLLNNNDIFINKALKTCELLENKTYRQASGTDYVFIDEDGIKAISYDGTWSTENEKCLAGEHEGEFILNGKDKTNHKVEIKINGNYINIYNTEFEYKSKITIGKDGNLIGRKITDYLGTVKDLIKRPVVINEKIIKNNEIFINEKFYKYQSSLEKILHLYSENMKCAATFGKNYENIKFLSFICPRYNNDSVSYYVRTMKEQL